jgi:hypothetical protein
VNQAASGYNENGVLTEVPSTAERDGTQADAVCLLAQLMIENQSEHGIFETLKGSDDGVKFGLGIMSEDLYGAVGPHEDHLDDQFDLLPLTPGDHRIYVPSKVPAERWRFLSSGDTEGEEGVSASIDTTV